MGSEDKHAGVLPEFAEKIDVLVQICGDLPSSAEFPRRLKRPVTIRLDSDVYAWFQLSGRGYQTRINAVLRAFMESASVAKRSATPEALHGEERKPLPSVISKPGRGTHDLETPLPLGRRTGVRQRAKADQEGRSNDEKGY